jgi:hypothetical protein
MAEQRDGNQQPAQPFGRPLKFKTVAELDTAIDAYLGDCAPHIMKTQVRRTKLDGGGYWAEDEVISEQKPVTVSGAAYAMGTNRRTLLDYKERSDFLPSIQRLLDACEAYTESQLFTNAANGAKFSLINNFKGKHQDWSDKHEFDHTTKGQPMPLLGGTVELPASEEGEDERPD